MTRSGEGGCGMRDRTGNVRKCVTNDKRSRTGGYEMTTPFRRAERRHDGRGRCGHFFSMGTPLANSSICFSTEALSPVMTRVISSGRTYLFAIACTSAGVVAWTFFT